MNSTINYNRPRWRRALTRRGLGTSVQAGFTIVETLIVLAIAGLILLIVFEVIPAVERASRNNQRRQDVTVILAAVSQYELKDSGNFPQACSGTSPLTACSAPHAANPNDYFLRFSRSDLSYYTSAYSTNPVQIIQDYPQNTGNLHPPVAVSVQTVLIYDFEKCDPTIPGGATSDGADYSSVVALYAVEGGNGAIIPQCQDI
ncbi:MAG TPA: type II secretion system protein [Candidatus Dormibacteraeota bacterium]|nr:type II secretion system protein [Candidatus Dormibacteraeota bacterium]